MNLVFKNITSSIKAYNGIYILLIVSQIIAVIILLFTYCVFSCAQIKKQEQKEVYGYGMHGVFTEPISVDSLKEVLPIITANMNDNIKDIFFEVDNGDEKFDVSCVMDFKDGKYCMQSDYFTDKRLYSGRYINGLEMNDGSKVVFGFGSYEEGRDYSVGDKCILFGEEYEIVGIIDGPLVTRVSLPLNSCTKEMKTYMLQIDLDTIITKSEYDFFTNTLREYYGNNVQFSEFEVVDMSDYISYNTVIIMAFVIGVIMALDTILVFNYILKKRRRQMQIWSILGAKRSQQIGICMVEIIIITLLTMTVGFLIFKICIEKALIGLFDVGLEIFNVKLYLTLLGIYCLSIMLGTGVMITINTKTSMLDWRRR